MTAARLQTADRCCARTDCSHTDKHSVVVFWREAVLSQTAAISHLRKEELKFTSSSYTINRKLESAAVNEEVDMVGISSSAPSTGTLTPTMEEVPLPPSVRSRDDESIVCCFP
ncbi:hypothetical protein AOLI_G00324430 [Acnodon oligacanthus]